MATARNSDPETSHLGAQSVAHRAVSQRQAILAVHVREARPMIDAVAAGLAGLDLDRSCFWKRCSELREMGFIAWAMDENDAPIRHRSDRTNDVCRASIITIEGLSEVFSHPDLYGTAAARDDRTVTPQP